MTVQALSQGVGLAMLFDRGNDWSHSTPQVAVPARGTATENPRQPNTPDTDYDMNVTEDQHISVFAAVDASPSGTSSYHIHQRQNFRREDEASTLQEKFQGSR